MVFALKDARRQLSEDVGDFFVSTNTGAGSTTTVVDTRLTEEDNDAFITRLCTVYIVGGQASGPGTDEERRIAADGLTSATLTVRRAFSAMASGLQYEVHRLFTGDEKNRAVARALEMCTPIIWKHVLAEITLVENQHEYDLTVLETEDEPPVPITFYRNEPHQVSLVSTNDNEHEQPIWPIEMRNGTHLYLPYHIEPDRIIRLRGIGTPAISNLDQGELFILTARAAMILASQATRQGPVDRRTFFEDMEKAMTGLFQERVVRYMKPAPPKNYRTHGLGVQVQDVNWRLP